MVAFPINTLRLSSLAASTLEDLGLKITQVEIDHPTIRFRGPKFREISIVLGETCVVAHLTLKSGETQRFESDMGNREGQPGQVHDALMKLFHFWTNPPIPEGQQNAQHRCVLVWCRPEGMEPDGAFRVVLYSDVDQPLILGNYASIRVAVLQANRKGHKPTAWKRPAESTFHPL